MGEKQPIASAVVVKWLHRHYREDAIEPSVLAKSQSQAVVPEKLKSWLHSSREQFHHHQASHCLSYQVSQWVPMFFCEGVVETLPRTSPAMTWLAFPSKHRKGNLCWGRWVSLETWATAFCLLTLGPTIPDAVHRQWRCAISLILCYRRLFCNSSFLIHTQ